MESTFKTYLENSFRSHWELPALTDYQGETLSYGETATQIARFHLLFKEAGIQPGDKIAICGRNSSHWANIFLAIVTYGTVAVPLLHEFTPESIHALVVHSESRLLFITDNLWEQLDHTQMPDLESVILLGDYTLAHTTCDRMSQAHATLDERFKQTYPTGYTRDQISYYEYGREDMILLNYTSGTTAASKGVMLPERALCSNMAFAHEVLPMLHSGHHVLSMLPLAHMYGMAFEFLYEITVGVHIFFITRPLSPKLILKAFADVHPALVVAVPLIIEKIIRQGVFPVIHNRQIRLLRHLPIVKNYINRQICNKLIDTFGGEFYEVIIGGAAFSHEVEQLLREIHFPFTVGYGMTECGPIIGYSDWHRFVPESCGKPAPRMKVRIMSDDPLHTPGEIMVKGTNVMLGYYKNEEATRQTLDDDGWMHTGDMGITDESGNIFIKGRCKNMLLGASGQNIYPEAIEDAVGSLPYVLETVVVQRDAKLYALVYPDYATARNDGFNTPKALLGILESHRKALNSTLASYEQLSGFELREEEFEKTPKKSIKRYLYQ